MVRGWDTIVVGSGTAGACIAGRLAERSAERVLLIEAGPDYGPVDSGRWPDELLDPSLMAVHSHSWNYVSGATHGLPNLDLQRARVMGGCSSHNGCAVVWGHSDDYDAWTRKGVSGWGAADLTPYFERANERFRVFTPERSEITPFHRAILDTAPALGYPYLDDFCNFDILHGFGIGPLNVASRTRWNAGFAYVDPVRGRSNFAIAADTIVDRVLLEGDRAVGLVVIGPEGRAELHADRIVLAGGAYGSPLILQRSGVGDPADLQPHGIDIAHELRGVGKNLQDHPAIALSYSGTPELFAKMDAFLAEGGLPREEGTIALASSSRCEEFFDLHLYPVGSEVRDAEGGHAGWSIVIAAAVMAPRSAGFIRITGTDPEAAPLIDHCYLTDPEEYDLDALVDAVGLIRDLATASPLAELIGAETSGAAGARDKVAIKQVLPSLSSHDYHPTSTCAMGPASDPMAVTDERGKVHGIDGLYIGDAAIFPSVPRANTNLPVLAVSEKMADLLSA